MLRSANKQKKAKLQQKLQLKHRKLLAKENIIESSYDSITDQKTNENRFQKPNLSFSCLTAMALNSSESGWLLVSEIYSFICENFPYFKTAPSNWKNSIRHALCMNKIFVKQELNNGRLQKRCLWSLDSSKRNKLDKKN